MILKKIKSCLDFTHKKKDLMIMWLPSACQLMCHNCSIWKKEAYSHSIEALKQKLLKLKTRQFSTVKNIVLVGGSPINYPYLDDLLNTLKKQQLNAYLVSHILYKKDILHKIARCFRKIWVPFPAADRFLFFQRTGVDQWDRYLANIRYLHQLGLSLHLVYQVQKEFVFELPDIYDLAFELGVHLEIIYEEDSFSKDEKKHIEHFKSGKQVRVFKVKKNSYPERCFAAGAFFNEMFVTHMIE